MRRSVILSVVLSFCISTFAFSQAGAQLTGTVTDPSNALLPGVTITATNPSTGVTTSTISNESGVYSFPSLQPGTAYRVSASLPGFQTKSVTDLTLTQGSVTRTNFQMELSSTQTTVEVSTSAQAALTQASASVGDVITEYRVNNLPTVGNNVLNLLNILPGLRISPIGQASDTVGGLGLNTVNVSRDGLTINDTRFQPEGDLFNPALPYGGGFGTMSPTTINPDLVGEIRLILSPVDAELGRGNSQIQVQTRSGTNKYSGSAVWNIQNTALNANTWNRNNDVNAAGQWSPTKPDWRNMHEYTISFGGPIVRNKTFFYVLWDQNISNLRQTITSRVLTKEARNGIFRFWEGWVGDSASPLNNPTTYPVTGTNPSIASVDNAGNPLMPLLAPNNTPYTGRLICFSVFGTQKADGTSFGSADCPSGVDSRGNAYTGVAMFPPLGASNWDPKRPGAFNTAGYFSKILTKMPLPNDFNNDAGDGLINGSYKYLLTRRIGDPVFYNETLVGTDPLSNRKQINIKIDQNFKSHRISGGWTYQLDDNNVLRGEWPDGLSGLSYRRPHILTVNVTSTLSPNLLNEARFGLNLNKASQVPPWLMSDDKVRNEAEQYLTTGGSRNGVPYPVIVRPTAGTLVFGAENTAAEAFDNGVMQTNLNNSTIVPNYARDPLYNFADTVSWSRGKHAFKFGGDVRLPRTKGYVFQPDPVAIYGNLTGLSSTQSPFGDAAYTGLGDINTFRQTSRSLAASLAYVLTDSIGSLNTPYWIENASDAANGINGWQDITTRENRFRETVSTEYAFFAKDDYKLTRDLTLNLGLRYEYYSPPYLRSGLTSTIVDLGSGLFGASRSADAGGQLFNNWLQPGNLYLANYGNNSSTYIGGAGALACTPGVRQNTNLPLSTCDPAQMTNVEFIGPNSPSPDKTIIPRDRNNFGPAVGFSWQVPFLGAGKTTVRGGYQVTFQRVTVSEATLASALGINTNATMAAGDADVLSITQPSGQNRAILFSDIPTLVPRLPAVAPGQAVPIYARSATTAAYAPDLATPYTQNLTLSVTRSLSRTMTLDVRYIGTLARKLVGNMNLNTGTVMYNPKLFDALVKTRRGENVDLFDQMFAGLRLNGVPATYPIVDGITGRGSEQLRLSTNTQANLANGNFSGVMNTLVTLTASAGATGVTGLTPGPAQTVLHNGCDRIANGLYDPNLAASSSNIPTQCFSEDYLVSNPQLSTATYNANLGRSNYHALQVQFSMRPTHGLSFQTTYSWAKSMQLAGTGYTDPLMRDEDRARGREGPHSLRLNGTFEVPVGPNKLFFGNTSGWVARVIEGWQTSFILNLATGSPADVLGAGTMRYANARYVATPYWKIPKGHVEWNGAGGNSGTFYGTNTYFNVPDPQCKDASVVQQTSTVAGATPLGAASLCTLGALAIKGLTPYSPGDVVTLPDGSTGVYGLVNPLPGQFGTLGMRTLDYWGQFSLDANAQKTFRINESKSISVRVDATNVLNHPQPAIPNYTINGFGSGPLGAITGFGGDAKTGSRTFQGQVRLTF